MPRVYITKQQQMNNRLVSLIYGTMKVQHVTQRQMADKLGISQQAYAKKLKKCQFTFVDLVTIFEELDMQDEEILSVMRER
jgi:DNA-binding transcriptional regulator LsrR (DeoR family)